MVKKAATIIMVCLLFMNIVVASGQLYHLEISQIEHRVPELTVYFNVFDENEQAITGSLNSNEVKVLVDGIETEEGIVENIGVDSVATHCLFLIDISTSVTPQQMDEIKNFVNLWISEKKEFDEVGIITFGESIHIVHDLSPDNTSLTASLTDIVPDENGTSFYDGIDQGLNMLSLNEKRLEGRKIIISFSDAEDIDAGGKTLDEIKSMLEVSNMPMYGIGTVTKPNELQQEYLDNFALLSRTSGGKYYQQSLAGFQNIYEDISLLLDSQFTYKVNTGNKQVDFKEKELTLTISDGSVTFMDKHKFINSIKLNDVTPPTLIDLAYDPYERKGVVTFSEEITIADPLQGLKVTTANEIIYLPATYVDEAQTQISFVLPVEIGGPIKFEFENFTDTSDNLNVLEYEPIFTEIVKGEVIEEVIEEAMEDELIEEEPEEEIVEEVKKPFWTIYKIIGLAAILLLIAMLILRGHIKRNKGLVVTVSYYDPHKDKTKQFSTNLMKNSILIGRSNECNIQIDDTELSRRHCSIYFSDGHVFLEDLGSSNGSFLNNKRLRNPEIVDDGSSFKVGKQEYRISVSI